MRYLIPRDDNRKKLFVSSMVYEFPRTHASGSDPIGDGFTREIVDKFCHSFEECKLVSFSNDKISTFFF